MGGSGSSSGGTSYQTNTIRYADYIETKHKVFLEDIATYKTALKNSSPFNTYAKIDINTAFLGAGIAITNFASLFSSYETLLLDYDLDASYNTIMAQVVDASYVKDLVASEGAFLTDELENETLPRLMLGARDINSVMSSTFIIAKSNVEAARVKAISKFSSELKYRLIPVALDRWKTTLEWRKTTIEMYAQLFKLYFAGKFDEVESNYEILAKHTMWPFTVLDQERAALGAMQGANTSSGSVKGGEVSKVSKAIGGAMSGAATGMTLSGGNPIGAGVGGLVGLAAGLLG